MARNIEGEVQIYVSIEDLVKPHDNLIMEKVVEELSAFDPNYDGVYFSVRDEFEDDEGNFDEAKVEDIMCRYSDYDYLDLVHDFYTIKKDEMYIEKDECELEEGVVCIMVPYTFDVDDFVYKNCYC